MCRTHRQIWEVYRGFGSLGRLDSISFGRPSVSLCRAVLPFTPSLQACPLSATICACHCQAALVLRKWAAQSQSSGALHCFRISDQRF